MEEVKNQDKANALLKEVIGDAKALGIPVSASISPIVVINKRAKSRFGCCKRKGNQYIIEICDGLIDGEPIILKQILAHEILHTCYGCNNHGMRWKSYAAKMTEAYGYQIKRTTTHEELGLKAPIRKKTDKQVRYIFTCMSCGAEIRRTRMSRFVKYPHLYRCRCGGKLRRKESDDE